MNKAKFVSLVAGVVLAMAFTFSCSSGGDDGGGEAPPANQGGNSSSSGDGGQPLSSGGGGSSSSVGGSSSGISYINFTDSRDGRTYKSVVIGTQTWLAENLNYSATDSRCYNDSLANCAKYGKLYDWSTAMSVCPDGWHLPSQEEWMVMTVYIGGANTEGKKLKATSGWGEYNEFSGTDDYGFSALPGGLVGSNLVVGVGFFGAGESGRWWSANELNSDSSKAYYRRIYYNDDVSWEYTDKSYMHSVRCLQGGVNVASSSSSNTSNPSSSSSVPQSSSSIAPSSSSVVPSSSSSAPQSSSSNQSSKLYCDFGPVNDSGGGCFEIADASECDTDWGQVVNSCNTEQLYCDFGPVNDFGGGCFEITNASECDTDWGQVVNSCN